MYFGEKCTAGHHNLLIISKIRIKYNYGIMAIFSCGKKNIDFHFLELQWIDFIVSGFAMVVLKSVI